MNFSMVSSMVTREAAIKSLVSELKGKSQRSALQHLLSVSQQLVPLKEGHLQATGHVSEEGDKGSVSYGSEEVRYAAVQHENLAYHHPNGRQAKYLEQPMLSEAGTMFRLIGEGMKF